MLIDFCTALRDAKIPVSTKEFLVLLEAMGRGVIGPSLDEFYVLSRCTLIKDEALFDKFDRAFSVYVERARKRADFAWAGAFDWLRGFLEREVGALWRDAIGPADWDALLDKLHRSYLQNTSCGRPLSELDEVAASPVKRAQSGFGKHGGGGFGAWDERYFKDYDHSVELGTRNLKVALRGLRRFAREGSDMEFDLDGTIRATANNAGWIDIKTIPRRHNRPKVLLLMDVGGTMDEHISRVEELFSAVKSEFKRLEFFYFHNCVYDYVWKHNRRSEIERTSTFELMRTYDKDHMLMFVGDATMSSSEILNPGGGVEYNNKESGAQWLKRLLGSFPKHIWINPEPQQAWAHRQTIGIVKKIMNQRMVPLTVKGLEDGMQLLNR